MVDVREPAEYNSSHTPGSSLIPRRLLEFQMAAAVPCTDGRNSILGGAALMELGYRDVRVLAEGMSAWRRAALPVETGLSGIMTPAADVLYAGPDRNYADMMNYPRWETALGEKYAK